MKIHSTFTTLFIPLIVGTVVLPFFFSPTSKVNACSCVAPQTYIVNILKDSSFIGVVEVTGSDAITIRTTDRVEEYEYTDFKLDRELYNPKLLSIDRFYQEIILGDPKATCDCIDYLSLAVGSEVEFKPGSKYLVALRELDGKITLGSAFEVNEENLLAKDSMLWEKGDSLNSVVDYLESEEIGLTLESEKPTLLWPILAGSAVLIILSLFLSLTLKTATLE